jgi:hypothetical protein
MCERTPDEKQASSEFGVFQNNRPEAGVARKYETPQVRGSRSSGFSQKKTFPG